MLLSNILALNHSHIFHKNIFINKNNPEHQRSQDNTTPEPRHVRARATSNQTGPVKMTKVKTSHAQKKRLARYSPCRPPLAGSSDTLRTNCEARASPVAYIMKRSEAQTSNATGRHKKKMPRNGS